MDGRTVVCSVVCTVSPLISAADNITCLISSQVHCNPKGGLPSEKFTAALALLDSFGCCLSESNTHSTRFTSLITLNFTAQGTLTGAQTYVSTLWVGIWRCTFCLRPVVVCAAKQGVNYSRVVSCFLPE